MRIFGQPRVAYAHCDLPCGVYDPAQARIEAESCYKIIEKYAGSTDQVFRARKASVDTADAAQLLDMIDGIDKIWRETGGLEKSRVMKPPKAA
ncbi:MAG: hypothetical protein HYX56_02170 [Chloroflexi bacterium]|nr:hypothetical protein [Chloroflexota bacterium]